jgi:hypothetical protein
MDISGIASEDRAATPIKGVTDEPEDQGEKG